LRNLKRNKLVSCINIAGLAIGFAAALLIGLLALRLSLMIRCPANARSIEFHSRPNGPAAAEVWDTADPSVAAFLRLDYPEIAMSAHW
jgi:hypothetical protein